MICLAFQFSNGIKLLIFINEFIFFDFFIIGYLIRLDRPAKDCLRIIWLDAEMYKRGFLRK